MVSVAISEELLEAKLEAGQLLCPVCSAPLAGWGFAREREVRMLSGMRSVRPRRGHCRGCGATHVLSPAWLVPRRRDGVEVIGVALRQAAGGDGHRRIARRLDRPPGTVRGWLRAARARSEQLRRCGTLWACSLDPELARIPPAGSPLVDALEALASAARAHVLRFGRRTSEPWELIVLLSGGRLFARTAAQSAVAACQWSCGSPARPH